MTDTQQESAALLKILELFQQGIPFADWPEDSIALLWAALDGEGCAEREQAKARLLERHLFRNTPAEAVLPAKQKIEVPRNWAERVRADLAGLVPLGAGLWLGLAR